MLTTDIQKCRFCGAPVRIVRRSNGSADHYESIPMDNIPVAEPSQRLLDFLRVARKGKKTVAIVGSAWSSRGFAPYGEVEVWCCNELHGKTGIGKSNRWFQLHPRSEFTKEHPSHHWEWLQQKHDFPIYMQREYDGVPDATYYPLKEIQDKLLTNIWKGEELVKKIFGSTMTYQVALALYEGFERIELFGIELVLEGEWAYQRESMAFWLGKADGMGVEVWMPETCELFRMPLYGYEEVRKGDGSFVEIKKEDQ